MSPTAPPTSNVVVTELRSSDVVRSVLAIALTASLPFALFLTDAQNDFTKTYAAAITAVVAYYFAVRGAEGAMAQQEGGQ